MNFIKIYFLRLYAVELSKDAAGRASVAHYLGPYGEAVLRTVLLVVIVMAGLGASALAAVMKMSGPAREFLIAYRGAVLVVFGVGSVIAAHVLVTRCVREFKHSPQSAAAFATERDRWIRTMQLYCILVCSLSAPVLTNVLMT